MKNDIYYNYHTGVTFKNFEFKGFSIGMTYPTVFYPVCKNPDTFIKYIDKLSLAKVPKSQIEDKYFKEIAQCIKKDSGVELRCFIPEMWDITKDRMELNQNHIQEVIKDETIYYKKNLIIPMQAFRTFTIKDVILPKTRECDVDLYEVFHSLNTVQVGSRCSIYISCGYEEVKDTKDILVPNIIGNNTNRIYIRNFLSYRKGQKLEADSISIYNLKYAPNLLLKGNSISLEKLYWNEGNHIEIDSNLYTNLDGDIEGLGLNIKCNQICLTGHGPFDRVNISKVSGVTCIGCNASGSKDTVPLLRKLYIDELELKKDFISFFNYYPRKTRFIIFVNKIRSEFNKISIEKERNVALYFRGKKVTDKTLYLGGNDDTTPTFTINTENKIYKINSLVPKKDI